MKTQKQTNEQKLVDRSFGCNIPSLTGLVRPKSRNLSLGRKVFDGTCVSVVVPGPLLGHQSDVESVTSNPCAHGFLPPDLIRLGLSGLSTNLGDFCIRKKKN